MFKKLSIVLVTGILLSCPRVNADEQTAVDSSNDPFRGEWTFQVTPDEATANEGQNAFAEEVLFHNGEFSAAAFAMFGFVPAQYSLAKADGVTTFTAVLTSEDRGTLTWTGHLSTAGLTGELVWARPGGVNYRFTIAGEHELLQ